MPLNIINHDAEDGGTTGWTVTDGNPQTYGGPPTPFDGTSYFYGGNGATAAMEQIVTLSPADIILISGGNWKLHTTYRQNSFNSVDEVYMVCHFLGVGDVLLYSKEFVKTSTPASVWVLKEMYTPVPAGTLKIKFEIKWVRQSGTDSDGYIDGITGDLVAGAYHVGILNGGAELNSTANWEKEVGVFNIQTLDPGNYPAANSGTYYFQLAGVTSTINSARMRQYIELTASELINVANGGVTLTSSMWTNSFDGSDTSRLSMNIYDDTGSQISAQVGVFSAQVGWLEKTLTSSVLPTNAKYLEIIIDGLHNAGGASDVYIDDVTYSLTAPPSPDQLGVYKLSSYMILNYAPFKITKASVYSVLSVSIPAKISKLTTYSVIRPNRAFISKVSSYTALRPNRAFAKKITSYTAMVPRVPSQRLNVLKTYTVLSSLPPVVTTKATSYTVLQPPPPNMRNRKSGAYTILSVVPPVKLTKILTYSVMKSPPPITLRALCTYTIVTPPPIALVNKKITSYTVMAAPPTAMTKLTTYSVLIPLSGVPLKAKKVSSYTVIKFNAVINPNQNIVVIVN